jgi:hypothetical protein
VDWELVHTVSFYQSGDPFLIDCLFNNSLLIIQAVCPVAKPTWDKAGLIRPVLDVPNIGLVRGNYQLISLETQLIYFSWLTAAVPEFKLEFLLYGWLPSINLSFWKTEMSLYPINPPDAINPNQISSFNSISVTVTTVASKIFSANPSRKGFSVYNPDGSKPIYLDFVSNMTAATASVVIPPGTNYQSDFDWIGEVYALTKSGSVTISGRDYV